MHRAFGMEEEAFRAFARTDPGDTDVPEVGDEPAAGRAMYDLGRRPVDIAERDLDDLGTAATGRGARPEAGRPMPGRKHGG